MSNIKLISDFTDYYDHYFQNDGIKFSRHSEIGPDKIKQFKIIEEMGSLTVPHGIVSDFLNGYYFEDEMIRSFVVYDNPELHCGEGRTFYRNGHRLKFDGNISRLGYLYKEWNKPASLYIARGANGMIGNPETLRLLQIGRKCFWIEYKSDDQWRSNCGNVECKVVGTEDRKLSKFPIYAIDFVVSKEMYGIDLNISPGVRGTGVERLLPPKYAYDEIALWFSEDKSEK